MSRYFCIAPLVPFSGRLYWPNTNFVDAGIDEKEAKQVTGDEYEDLQETKSKIREQTSNGVDSVPFMLIEGRRDITIQGANEVEDYVKALEQIVKESNWVVD